MGLRTINDRYTQDMFQKWVAVFAQAANSPSAHTNFVETSKKEFPTNVVDPIFYIFVFCKICVFVENTKEISSSRPEIFVAFE